MRMKLTAPEALKRCAYQKYQRILTSIVLDHKRMDSADTVRVLDIGAGNCWMLNLVPSQFMKIGLDLHAHEHFVGNSFREFVTGESSHFMFGDATNLPFPDSSFDVVYSNEFISHVKSIDESIAEQIRVVKRGGTILIMDSNPLNPITLFTCLVMNFVRSRKHRGPIKRGGVRWLFHRQEAFRELAPMKDGVSRLVCWTDENIHTQYWWRRKLRAYSDRVDFKTSIFWSYPSLSWFTPIANKILIVGNKM